MSYATVCLHPSVSLNNEKICCEFSEHRIAVCEKSAGLRSGNSSDLNSACLKVLVRVEIFQFSDMHYETERHRDSTDGLDIFRSMFLAEPFRTLHECGDSVSAHSCLQLAVAMEIVRMQMSCIQKQKIVISLLLNVTYRSARNGMVLCKLI